MWEQGAPPVQLPSLGYGTPACPCSLKKANFSAVKGRFGFPAARSTTPLSSTGTMGGPSSLPYHLGFACAPGQHCPKGATSPSQPGCTHGCTPVQPSARCRAPATTMSPGHLPSHPAAWHAVPPWPLPHSEHLCCRLEPARLCPGQQSQREHSTTMCRRRTEPCRKRHLIQVPRGRCPAPPCRWVTGRQLPSWHGVGSSRREGATPAHLLQVKVTGVLMAPPVQPLISFIDLFFDGVI